MDFRIRIRIEAYPYPNYPFDTPTGNYHYKISEMSNEE